MNLHRFLLLSIISLIFTTSTNCFADNWETIVKSDKYYYGTGLGDTEQQAREKAMQEMSTSISTIVQSNFNMLSVDTRHNSDNDYRNKVERCIRTYSNNILRSVKRMPTEKKKGQYLVRVYMEKSEMDTIYKYRINEINSLCSYAEDNLQDGYIDFALEKYYNAYALLHSLPLPEMAKTLDGKSLKVHIPNRIENILRKVKFEYKGRDENNDVGFNVYYDGKPVSGLVFKCKVGNNDFLDGNAKDGNARISLPEGYADDKLEMMVEYEFRNSGKDQYIAEVLDLINIPPFQEANKSVDVAEKVSKAAQEKKDKKVGIHLNPVKEQTVDNDAQHRAVVEQLFEAVRHKNLNSVNHLFTAEGRRSFDQIMRYGAWKLEGTPHLHFFKGVGETVVVRGMQMSCKYKERGGNTYHIMEDVIITIGKDNKIQHVAFGLGQQVQKNIIEKKARNWGFDAAEVLTEFLEGYKTAYCTKDLRYIEQIFAEDAIIIVGNMIKVDASRKGHEGMNITSEGMRLYTENRQTKAEYLKRLERVFHSNEFINLRFENTDIQLLEKHLEKGKKIFGVRLKQHYHSTNYSDMGHLYLMIDMTDSTQPIIKIRTWQPEETRPEDLFHSGKFLGE